MLSRMLDLIEAILRFVADEFEIVALFKLKLRRRSNWQQLVRYKRWKSTDDRMN